MEDPKISENYEKTIRIGFVRKVYGILLAQCAFTTFLCFLSMTSPKFSTFQKENVWLLILTIVLSIIVFSQNFIIFFKFVIILSCFQNMARTVPTNYILLFAFTLCEAYLTSYICSNYSAEVVLTAAALTTAAVIGLTLYACYTKTDFTILGGMLFVILLVFFVFGLILMFVKIKILHLIYCIIGVILFSIYLIYDT